MSFRYLILLGCLLAANPSEAATYAISLSPSAGLGLIPDEAYCCNHYDVSSPVRLRRYGGNRATGYNWENNASNAGTDYLDNSDYWLLGQVGLPQTGTQAPASVPVKYVQGFRTRGTRAEIVTLQAAGYVAADAAGPVSAAQTAPSSRWKAVLPHKPGWPASLTLNPDKSDGSVYVDEQVHYLIQQFGLAGAGGIRYYAIDNEPGLWDNTHHRLHPGIPTYAELLARTTATAEAVLDTDPGAQILGAVSYGWDEFVQLGPSSDAAGNNPTYGWWLGYFLEKMQLASQAQGRRLLHYLDLHWYPEAQGFNGSANVRICSYPADVSQGVAIARMQAPRSLWDTGYQENSWIRNALGGPIRLIPRVRQTIDQRYPGTKLMFSEYDYGAPDDVSGGIAQADVLGILGRYGVGGCRWGAAGNGSYVKSAFDLYLNYDGAGAAFGDLSFSAGTNSPSLSSVYAAKRSTDPGLLTVVVLNKDYSNSATAAVSLALAPGQSIQSIAVRRFDPSGSALQSPASPAFGADSFSDTLPARSATLYVLRLADPASPTPSATPSATPSPSPNGSPGVGANDPRPLSLVPVPHPQSGSLLRLSLELEGPADALRLSLFSPAMVLLRSAELAGPFPAGWSQISSGLRPPRGGLYYLVVTAARGGGRWSSRPRPLYWMD